MRRSQILASIVIVGLTGCSTVPTGGRVDSRPLSARQGDPLSEPYVRKIAPPPKKGASPTEIVTGFLIANGSFDENHRVAREYLTEEANRAWHPERQRISVYSRPPASTERGSKSDASVTAEFATVGEIDQDRRYKNLVAKPTPWHFAMTKVDGEWRITQAPPLLYLTKADVDRNFRPANLYFFDPFWQVLVPEPVYLPVYLNADRSSSLVSGLLRETRLTAVRSAFPTGTKARVTTDGGYVTVNLTGQARVGPEQQGRMAAQLVWTLRQLPDLERVTMQVGGVAVSFGGKTAFGRDELGAFDPNGLSGLQTVYYERNGRFYAWRDGAPSQPVAGAAGVTGAGLTRPAVSFGSGKEKVAGLAGERTQVLASDVVPGARLHQWMKGNDFTTPSWDRYGNLWAADRTSGGSLVMISAGTAVRVDVPIEISGGQVTALRVARDGCRVAIALTDDAGMSQLMVGQVVRDRTTGSPLVRPGDGVAIKGLTALDIPVDNGKVIDVVWQDAGHLIVLVQAGEAAAPQPYKIMLAGNRVEPLLPTGRMHSLAASPVGPKLIAGVDEDTLMIYEKEKWTQPPPADEVQGRNPAYPG